MKQPAGFLPVAPAALAVSAFSLGCALQINFGQYDSRAVGLLTVSLAACVSAMLRLAGRATRILVVLCIWLAIQFAILIVGNPLATATPPLLAFRIGIVLSAVFLAIAIRGGRFSCVALAMMIATHFSLGLWCLRAAPRPAVDVCVFQTEAARALLHGQNPYAMTFANLYADPQGVYGAGTFAAGRVLFGFPYPPFSLLLVLPGYLLGDFRIAHLVATTIAGTLVATVRRSPLSIAAGAMFLFTPRIFFVLEAGWTEPLAAMLLAGVVFAAARRSAFTFVLLALLLVVKQYLVLLLPIALVLLVAPIVESRRREGHSNRRALWLAVTLATVVTLPLAVWDFYAFVNSVVLLQFRQPLRMDALSYLSWVIQAFGIRLPTWIAFVGATVVTLWAIARAPRTPGGFAASAAIVLLVFFALNKQAFCNYYFLVIAALCCAVSASSPIPRILPARSKLPAEEEAPSAWPAMALRD
jgi:hypothetical protein